MKGQIFKGQNEEKKVFKKLLSLSQKSETDIFFKLGRSLMDEYAPKMDESAPRDFQYVFLAMRFDYVGMGKKFWATLRKKLYQLFCNKATKVPKAWVEELMGGELRNVGIALIGKVTKAYNVSVAVAIPIVALVLKKGISTFCSHPPK